MNQDGVSSDLKTKLTEADYEKANVKYEKINGSQMLMRGKSLKLVSKNYDTSSAFIPTIAYAGFMTMF